MYVSNVFYCQLEGWHGKGTVLASILPLHHHVTNFSNKLYCLYFLIAVAFLSQKLNIPPWTTAVSCV